MTVPKKPSRRHHYISQFYLKGFASDPVRPRLFAVDLIERRNFQPNTTGIALEVDFHTTEADGQPPDIVETALSKFEGDVAPALARTVASASFVSDDDKGLLVFFATLLLVKHPLMRTTWDDVLNKIMQYTSKAQAANPEAWTKNLQQMIVDGDMPPDTDIERLRQSILSDEHDISLSTGAHLETEFNLAKELFPLVAQRKWNVYKATIGEFVTCDRPVSLIWTDPRKSDPIGLAHRNTRLLFPLSPTVAISGGFELTDSMVEVGAEDVAKINGRIILNAGRQVYARDDQFEYMLQHNAGTKRGTELKDDAVAEHKAPW